MTEISVWERKMDDNPDLVNGLPNVNPRAMIRVTLTGYVREGRFDYRVETVNTRLAVPLLGLDADPLMAACTQLQSLAAADDGALVGLFDPGAVRWKEYATLGSANVVMQARSTEQQWLRSKSPELPIGTGRVHRTGPSTPIQPHRKPKRGGSGGRRGQR